jgi:hypothetical protein
MPAVCIRRWEDEAEVALSTGLSLRTGSYSAA